MQPAHAENGRRAAGGQAHLAPGKGSEAPLPSYAQLVEIGRDLVHRVFRLQGDTEPEKIEGAGLSRADRLWLRRRQKKLTPMAAGRIRTIPKNVWNVATLCMHPVHGLETIKRYAARVPSEFLAVGCAVALLRYDGSLRPVDSRRAQSILTLVITLWLLARPSKRGDGFGYQVLGLPYGAFCQLVSRFENFGRKQRAVPHVNTVWGTHRVGGRFDRAELGYMAALRQVGLIQTKQPPWWAVEAGRRGRPHTNSDGQTECWAFVEISLRIRRPGTEPMRVGPLPFERPMPPQPPPVVPPEPDKPQHVPLVAAMTEPSTESLLDRIRAMVPSPATVPDAVPPPMSQGRPTHDGVSLSDYLADSQDDSPFWQKLFQKRGPPKPTSRR